MFFCSFDRMNASLVSSNLKNKVFPSPRGSVCAVMHFKIVLLGLQVRNVFSAC